MSHLMADGVTPCGKQDGHSGGHTTPEAIERHNAQKRKRRANNPEIRERMNAHLREYRANNPEIRERMNAQERERKANDPEYRERRNAKSRDAKRKRRASDPTRERMNAQQRERRKRPGPCPTCGSPRYQYPGGTYAGYCWRHEDLREAKSNANKARQARDAVYAALAEGGLDARQL